LVFRAFASIHEPLNPKLEYPYAYSGLTINRIYTFYGIDRTFSFFEMQMTLCVENKPYNKINRIQEIINEDPGKSMRYIVKEMNMSDETIRKIVAEDIRYRSYIVRRGQFITQQTKERLFEKVKNLLAKLKNSKDKRPLIFFSDEKNFNRIRKSTEKIIDGCVQMLMKSELS